MNENPQRREMVNYVSRLIEYGKGAADPDLDALTLGQIADRLLALAAPVRPEAGA